MTQKEYRDAAISATRSEMRRMGIEPKSASVELAETILDEISRKDPDLMASCFYLGASGYQWEIFKREWRRYAKT